MATTLRNDAKSEIIKILRKQGYPTYARLVDFFDIYLTDDPEVIGYMIPDQAKIVLNKELNIDQVSTIVRHEVLHEYLTHGPRQQKFDKEHPELNPHLAPRDISNIAADFEISNKGYTDADKSIARRIKLGDKTLRGLVTEDEYPDWADMSYEEMYAKLLEKDKEDRQQIQQLLDMMSQLSKQDIDDMIQDAQNISDQMSGNSDTGKQGNSSDNNSDDNNSEEGNSSEGDSSDEMPTESGGTGDAEDTKSKSPAQIKQGADAAKKAASQLKDKANDSQQQSERSDNVFDTPKEQRDKVDVAARAKHIRDFIDDLKEQANIQEENVTAIRKEKAARAARDVDRYQGSGLNQFKLNLNRFIADQVGEMEDDSYARIHPSYEDSEFILPGKLVREEKNIPLINIYHDVSGSFRDERKTAAAFKAIETLNQYVRDGDIEIKLYYFADRVSESKNKAGSGTLGTPIQEHIEATKPTNVIIITDSDINDCSRVVKVPGAVWMLFYDARSQNVMDHIKGKRQNKYYDIDY